MSEDLDPSNDTIEHSALFARVLVPTITVLPLWLRFLQNLQRSYETRQRWPHLGNAMKYATAQTVALYGLHHRDAKNNALWIFGFVFATMYQFAWDIFMDWDLVRISRASDNEANDKHHRGRKLAGWDIRFREPLLYRSKSFYCLVALLNFLLRFFWTLTLIPEGGEEAWQKTIQVRLSPVLAAAEICRRCMWAFLRLENEHLHTYGTAIDDGFTALDEAELMALGPHAMEPMHVATGEISSNRDEISSATGSGFPCHQNMENEDYVQRTTNEPVVGDDAEVGANAKYEENDDEGKSSLLVGHSTSDSFAEPSLTLGFVVVQSSTASLTDTAVLLELTTLAAFVFAVGVFSAFGV